MAELFDKSNTQTNDTHSRNKTIFIWIDILGFADSIDKEDDTNNGSVAQTLETFISAFSPPDGSLYTSTQISDGIIIALTEEAIEMNSNPSSEIRELWAEIGKRQLDFILKNNTFLRGGIALGKLHGGDKNKYILSNGLARAHKIESSCISWPIVGTNEQQLENLREAIRCNDNEEIFGLAKSFNAKGGSIYFIDFLGHIESHSYECQKLLVAIIEGLKKFKGEPKVQAKYVWLLRYYQSKFDCTKKELKELPYFFDGAVL
ncbi:MAG: hypothetical protein AB7F23_10440 [Phycisphaerae bacterium]